MHHTLPLAALGPAGPDIATAIEKCVHCGFCLPTCPTYVTLGEEMDSPRGRIFLMKSALEGGLRPEETFPFVDRCLGCLACVTACPSGVAYSHLLTPYRALMEKKRARKVGSTLARFMARQTLPYPDRFRLAATVGKLGLPFKSVLPQPLAAMIDLLPEALPAPQPLPQIYPAQGPRRARVALLAGCVQQALAPNINWATLRVLARNGVEVIIPEAQGCCGALFSHNGDADAARAFARHNLTAFPHDVDAIVTNAAGCGSGMKEYELLFKGEVDEDRAHRFAAQVKDVSEFLDELGFIAPEGAAAPAIKVAYHDACHLAHAQRVTAAPRRLLRALPNVTLLDIPEGELCCGSAGTYSIEQPALAAQLGERKARNIQSVAPEVVAAGNIGCMVQIRKHFRQQGQPIEVAHTLEVIDRLLESDL